MWSVFDVMSGGSVYGPVKPVTTSRMPRTVRLTRSGDSSGGYFVRPGHEALFLDGHGEVALVRRRAHRIGARRLGLPLEVLEERGEAVERLELVGIDRQEMPGLVVEPVVAGKEHERRGVGRLDDDVGDHHLELLDSSRCGRGLFRLHAQG